MSDAPKDLTPLEAEVQKYKARWGLYKVIWGTVVVGLFTAGVSALIQWFEIVSQREQAEAELRQNRIEAEREHLGRYLEYALASDIEVRIRFAEYFCNLSTATDTDPIASIAILARLGRGLDETEADVGEDCRDPSSPWAHYHALLERTRRNLRDQFLQNYDDIRRRQPLGDEELNLEDAIQLEVLRIEQDWIQQAVGVVETRPLQNVQRIASSSIAENQISDRTRAFLRDEIYRVNEDCVVSVLSDLFPVLPSIVVRELHGRPEGFNNPELIRRVVVAAASEGHLSEGLGQYLTQLLRACQLQLPPIENSNIPLDDRASE